MACGERDIPESVTVHHLTPKYEGQSLILRLDTLHFYLNDSTFNNIKSMNNFIDHGIEYLCVYDERSESINFYDITSQQLVKKLLPKKHLQDTRLYKTSVYCLNFDSIFISNNKKKIYLLDSSCKIKVATKFAIKQFSNVAQLENSSPLVLKDSFVFAGIRPSGTITSIKKAREWRVMYRFNLHQNKKTLAYQLPVRYLNNLYGYNFMDYSYCFNNNNRFVFSFPADSNLFETDLSKLHIAHFAKSQWQKGDIEPLSSKEYIHPDSSYKQYQMSDAYGPVFFDPYHKRYLRYFRQKISEADYASKKFDKKSTVLIFNENLQIIGETDWPDGASFNTLFFTKDGCMYARVNRKDENALHFVRLEYKESDKPIQLAKKEMP